MPKLSSLFRFPSARRSSSRRDASAQAAQASSVEASEQAPSHASPTLASSAPSKRQRKASAVKAVASDREDAIDGSHLGMHDTSSRLETKTTTDGIVSASDQAHGVAASNNRNNCNTRVTSVEPLHPMHVGTNGDAYGSSGVYIVDREPLDREPLDTEPTSTEDDSARRANMMNPLLEQVTLVVYGWHNVEPGTLAWVFPSVGAAVAAARTMTNAVRWAIVAGRREASDDDLATARAHGAVLIEQAG